MFFMKAEEIKNYKELKLEYLKGDEFALDNFYNNFQNKELNKMKKELRKLFEEKKDEEAINYILNKYKDGAFMYFFSNFYDCEAEDCLSRLEKNYKIIYEKTRDIEAYSTILSFKSLLGEKKYKELEEFFIENKSLFALNRKKRSNDLKDEYDNPKIRIKGRNYTVLQKKEVRVEGKTKYVYIVINFSDEKKKSYLYYKGNKDYLIELETYIVGLPYEMTLIDLNDDRQEEIIVENLKDFLDYSNIFTFKIDNKKVEKIFELQKDMNLSNYFSYDNTLDMLNIKINDDFGFEKNFSYKLPNVIEAFAINNSLPRQTTGILDNKIIFRIKGYQNFEIVFDKNFNYNLKATDKYPVNYGVESDIIVNNYF